MLDYFHKDATVQLPVVAIEVKSNAEKRTDGLDKFRKLFNPQVACIVGDGGISAKDFLSMDVRKLF